MRHTYLIGAIAGIVIATVIELCTNYWLSNCATGHIAICEQLMRSGWL